MSLRMETFLLVIVCVNLSIFSSWAGTSIPVSEKVQGNQIVFRERGVVVNQAAFLHVRMPIKLKTVLKQGEAILRDAALLREEWSKTNDSTLTTLAQQYDFANHFGRGFSDLIELHDTNMEDDYLMADYLYKTIDSSFTRLTQLLSVLPSRKSLNENKLSHVVYKRSAALNDLLEVISSEEKFNLKGRLLKHEKQSLVRRRRRFIAGAIGIYYGVTASYRVDELVQKFNEFVLTKHAGMVDTLQEFGQNFTRLQLEVSLLTKIQIILAARRPHKFMAAHHYLNQRIHDIYDRITDAVAAAQNQKLSPNLLSGEELMSLYNVLVEHAAKHECALYVYQPSDLFQVEVSHIYNADSKVFCIFLHVPMVKHKNLLVLKEYVPFPLLLSFETNSTILPDVGDTKYLAIANDGVVNPTLRGRYRTFTEAELSACNVLGNLHLCPGRNTLRKDLTSTCIGSLIQRDPTKIIENCNMKISRPTEFVARISQNEWLISTPEPFSTNAVCKGSRTSHPLRIGPQSTVILPEDCEIELRDSVLSTDLAINIDFEAASYSCEDLPNVFAGFFPNITRLTEVIQSTLSLRGSLFSGDLQHLKQAEISITEYPGFDFSWLTGLFSSFVSTIMVIIFFVFGFFLTLLLARCGCCGCFFSLLKSVCINLTKATQTSSWKGSTTSLRNENVARERVIVIQDEPRAVSFEPSAPSAPIEQVEPPPPYNNWQTLPRVQTPRFVRSALRPTKSLMSIASGFKTPALNRSTESFDSPTPSAPEETTGQYENENARPCNIGPILRKGLHRNDFICTEHYPETGCIGNFCR